MSSPRSIRFAALAIAAAPLLGAGVVASNPRTSTVDGLYSDSYAVGGNYLYGQALAAKVVLTQAVDLTSIRFWGSSEAYVYTGLNNMLGFTVMFFQETSTTPALQYTLMRGSAITETYMNRTNADGGKEYQFTAAASGRLAAGTWYMHVGAILFDGQGDAWTWSMGTARGMHYAKYGTSWGPWLNNDFSSVAFELSGNPACTSDLDASGAVDMGDVALAMLDFGPCPGCTSDVDGNGTVDFGDVALLLLDIGLCP